jgi:predicted O-methyltransferase YrrM
MNSKVIFERLLEENPRLHYIDENIAQEQSDYKVYRKNLKIQAGSVNWSVNPKVISYLQEIVQNNHRTLETGSGHTTVAFATLASHHISINPNKTECGLIQDYMQKLDIPLDRVEFLNESSDTALIKLDPNECIDVAFIDGCHGFPFPILDWHYIDFHLKEGGILGVDDIDIPAVTVLCDFLRRNETYVLERRVGITEFYRKLTDEKSREAIFQKFNEENKIITKLKRNFRKVRHRPIERG